MFEAELSSAQIEASISIDASYKMLSVDTVLLDESRVLQILLNLINNAIKFTRERARAEIEIGRAKGSEHEAEVFVRDNGAGFDMKYVDKLFGVFQRLHHADAFEGTGIGLATVQRIVHRHGGKVRGEGAVDQGATFYFSVPKS